MTRDAGAKKVYFASAAPPVRFPNVYGIDMPTAGELIIHGRTEEEVEKLIGADWLISQDLEDLISSVAEENPDITEFDCSVFNGNYITGAINQAYLGNLEKTRCGQKQITDDCDFQDIDKLNVIDFQTYLQIMAF